MGRLTRKYIRAYKLTVAKGLESGIVASPLTQLVAGQIVHSAVIDAIALGGDVTAGLFRVNASVSMTGNLWVSTQ